MARAMTTSIALATYNGERHLAEQLDSFLGQTVLPDELVVSDDGSTDRTLEIIDDFVPRAPFPVRLLTGERVGFGQNFARAMAATTGEIVFLSDQDDFWETQKIERVLAEIDHAMLVVHDLMLCGPDLQPSGQTISERLRLLGMDEGSHIKGCCSAIRRELLELALPLPDDVAHDRFLHALAKALDGRRFIAEPLIRYRIHETNTSGWAVNSLAPVNRQLIFRLRLRALGKRLGRRQPSVDLGAYVAQRLAERQRE
jgi:glycosyltransferase involved in cell wall biosynthesis